MISPASIHRLGWRHRKLIRALVPSALLAGVYDALRWPPYRRASSGFDRAAAMEVSLALPFGLNVVGALRAESGIGEAARSTIRAARAADIPVALVDFSTGHPARMGENLPGDLPSGHPFAYNAVHVNAHEIPTLFAELGHSFFAGHRNIGCWNWELPEFPPRWQAAARIFHEIWAPSRFVQEALESALDIPVRRVPLCVSPPGEPDPALPASLGLPKDAFIFLSMFDALSVPERKNPLGAVEAFRRAFPGESAEGACLVLKASNGDRNRSLMGRLQDAAREDGRIRIVDRYLDRPALNALLAAADAFLSLHRSEGFGLALAEAMGLGKPVIATGWSGNVDFMNSRNAFPVPFEVVPLQRTLGPYRRGGRWAEPDIGAAARLMRQVFEDREAAAAAGRRAREDIQRGLSPLAVGRLMGGMIPKELTSLEHFKGGADRENAETCHNG